MENTDLKRLKQLSEKLTNYGFTFTVKELPTLFRRKFLLQVYSNSLLIGEFKGSYWECRDYLDVMTIAAIAEYRQSSN